MSTTTSIDIGDTYRIEAEMNKHGAIVLRDRDRGATYHVVDYASGVRDRVADLPAGSTVRLDLSRVGSRSNVWRANRILPGTTTSRSVSMD
jgi:hypothetical protein